jgi:predicted dehydrogenase
VGGNVSASGAYLVDAANGVSLASIVGGHSLHMLVRIVGEWEDFDGISANRRTEVLVVDSGAPIAQSSTDQFVAHGRLSGGVPAAVHLAGGVAGREAFELLVLGETGALRLSTPTVPEILPPILERTDADGEFRPVLIEPRFRLAPASLGEGPAVNVAQLYAVIAAELGGGERCAPDFADALALRQLVARTAN